MAGKIEGREGSVITNALIDGDTISGVAVGTGSTLTQAAAAANPGIDLMAAATDEPGLVFDLLHPIIRENDGDLRSAVDLIRDEINEYMGDNSAATNPHNSGTVAITARNLKGTFIPALITGIETTGEPNGVRYTPEGNLLVIRSGVAFTLTPKPVNQAAFSSGLAGIGYEGEIGEFGVVILTSAADERFGFRFGNFANSGQSNLFAVGTVSFSITAADPAVYAYTMMAGYPDGSTQPMHPAIHDISGVTGLLDGYGLAYQIGESGTLDLLGPDRSTIWRGMPDMVLRPPDPGTESPVLSGVGDMDGNGQNDFEYKTPLASQYIFAIPF